MSQQPTASFLFTFRFHSSASSRQPPTGSDFTKDRLQCPPSADFCILIASLNAHLLHPTSETGEGSLLLTAATCLVFL
ncbi:uncharacterized protein BDV14DRAFT_181996 [Aspergillus stella-maris]|uniref:uncharacterized protein n=1 Tax=Aspergillus stella-maris TaxID=1810926 RepID=UPI003CCCDFF8